MIKLISRILTAVVLSVVVPATLLAYDFSARDIDNRETYYFNITSNEEGCKTCEITYFNEEEVDGEIAYNTKDGIYRLASYIPKKVVWQGEEYLVTGIGDHAFQNTKIQYLGLSDHIKYIGDEAFKDCGALWTVDTNYVIERIGERAFENCTSLEYFNHEFYRIFSDKKPHLRISSGAFHGCRSLFCVNVNCYHPEDFDVAPDAFDIVEGRIDCKLYITPFYDFLERFSKAEPWKFFDIEENENQAPTDANGPFVNPANSQDVYDLRGVKVGSADTFSGLRHGLYIVNGVKVVR